MEFGVREVDLGRETYVSGHVGRHSGMGDDTEEGENEREDPAGWMMMHTVSS
jgi:hypothetical protein